MTSATPEPTARARRRTYPLSAILVALLAGIAVGVVAMYASDSSNREKTTRGSGTAAAEARDLPSFAAVELAGANTVHIAVGGEQAVVVRGDDNLLDRVVTEVRDGALVITNRGNVEATAPMSVDVTLPTLDTVQLTGTGTVEVKGLQADELTIRVPGAGTVTANGSVDRLVADLDGAAEVELGELVARHVTATLDGVGELRVHATGSLAATLSGTGAIYYAGHPRNVTQSVSGTGTIAAE